MNALTNTNNEIEISQHREIIWMHYANFFIGVFLITNPVTFGYHLQISGINEMLCGLGVALLSLLSVNPNRKWAPWFTAFIGLWLNAAPVFFWSPLAVTYNTDTFCGILIIVFSILAPGVPGQKSDHQSGDGIPLGWSVNPSSWHQRIPIIFIGWFGFFASRYLATYQLGYMNEAYDPFFDKGTEQVLNSEISKAWPVSDAGLGAFSYMLDAMMGYIGGTHRWRTMPWAVILFGFLIIPLGAVSIGLIILQPLAVGAWCSICLFTAAAMLIMIPCTFDEVFASVYFLKQSKKEGKPFWKSFFCGGTIGQGTYEKTKTQLPVSFKETIRQIFSGFNIPVNLLLCCCIGIWLMFSPAVFGYANSMANSDHVTGALVVTFSVIAMGEIVRIVRFINILFGVWIMAVPFLFGYAGQGSLINALVCGILLIVFSLGKGKIKNNYGTFNYYIR